MEDVAKLLGDHRKHLERWFDGEMKRLNIAKREMCGVHDDLARRVLDPVKPNIGNDGGLSHAGLSQAPCDSMVTMNVPASPAPMARAMSPPPVPPILREHDAMGGNMSLPGTVPECGFLKSAVLDDSPRLSHQDHTLSTVSLRTHTLNSDEEVTLVAAPIWTSGRQPSTTSVQLKESLGHSPRRVSKASTCSSPSPKLYESDGRPSLPRPMSRCSMTKTSQEKTSQEKSNVFSDTPIFRTLCGGLILLNAVFLGISADHTIAAAMLGKPDDDMVFEGIEISFAVLFLAELVLRLLAEGWSAFKSKSDGWWNIFDTVLVALSLIDVALTLSQAGQVINLTFARVMRLFRFVRILRIVRVMRFFYSFRLMVYSVMYSIFCLLWVFGMLLFIMYFFAMFFLHGISEHFQTYFAENGGAICETALCLELQRLCGDVVNMVLSLFMSICGGIDWRELYVILRDVSWVYGSIFVLYVFFMAFGVLNVVVATFVEQSSLISQRDRELVTQNELKKNQHYYEHLRCFFNEADIDGSGTLSWQEFEDYLGDENVQAYFQSFELDVTQAHTLFRLLDLDESDDVNIDEFVEGCMRMRGQARSIDVHMLLYENEKMIRKNMEFMEYVEEQLREIQKLTVSTPQ